MHEVKHAHTRRDQLLCQQQLLNANLGAPPPRHTHLLYGVVQQQAVGKGLRVHVALGTKVHLNEQVPAGGRWEEGTGRHTAGD